MKLVEAVADAGYSLLIVGPYDPRWEPRRFAALTARPSVRYVGSVPEEEVSAYIAAIDVGITPYMDNPFNKASFPLKTLDYLSAGRPAVSTTLPASLWLLTISQEAKKRPFLSGSCFWQAMLTVSLARCAASRVSPARTAKPQ